MAPRTWYASYVLTGLLTWLCLPGVVTAFFPPILNDPPAPPSFTPPPTVDPPMTPPPEVAPPEVPPSVTAPTPPEAPPIIPEPLPDLPEMPVPPMIQTPPVVPEPASAVSALVGLLAVGGTWWRAKRHRPKA